MGDDNLDRFARNFVCTLNWRERKAVARQLKIADTKDAIVPGKRYPRWPNGKPVTKRARRKS